MFVESRSKNSLNLEHPRGLFVGPGWQGGIDSTRNDEMPLAFTACRSDGRSDTTKTCTPKKLSEADIGGEVGRHDRQQIGFVDVHRHNDVGSGDSGKGSHSGTGPKIEYS